jgi:5'-deoxynucleotidase YfbR-like HD superfamily hydrolase
MNEPFYNKILELALLCLDYGLVNRKTMHQDGITYESDTTHTVMLGVIGTAVAAKLYPHLDLGKISQFIMVHDLVEVYAGDTPTLKITHDTFFQEKEERERQALERIKSEFHETFPWICDTIEEYERLQSPEARFVKAFDKILPKLTVILNDGASIKAAYTITKSDIESTFKEQKRKLETLIPEFSEILETYDYFVTGELKVVDTL